MIAIFNHFYEAKIRAIYIIFSFIFTFFVCYLYSEILIYLLSLPLISSTFDKKFMFTNLPEVFSSCLLVSFNASLLASLVFIFWMVLCFLKPGLYKREWYALNLSLKLISFNIFASIYFVYYFVLPGIIRFFVHFEFSQFFEITLEPKIFDYLESIFEWFFWLSFIFQLPVIIFLCLYLNFFSLNFFVNLRREFVMISFVFGAFLSPPDIITQLLIALPLCIFLEITIFSFLVIHEYLSISWESCSNGKR